MSAKTAHSTRTPPLPLALIVDDVAENRLLLAHVVRALGFAVVEAGDGEQAVKVALERRPDVILLDVLLPGISGLEALEQLRDEDADVPVVVVTAAEDPEIGERALELGAVNLLRKPFDPAEIGFVVGRIRDALEEQASVVATLDLVRERRTVLELQSEPERIAPVVNFLGRELRHHYPGHDVPLTRVKLALFEAITNAIEHGNLEIGYAAKTRALSRPGGIGALIERRRRRRPFRDRKVRIEAVYEPTRAVYRVRDEGAGFVPDLEEGAVSAPDTSALHGRGILLIRHYMDRVSWNDNGNEIGMTLALSRRREPATPGATRRRCAARR